jgi:hypothetical protein
VLPLEVPSGARILTVRVSSLSTEVYDPKAFILHAALLGQSCLHCPIFLTAASRRSLDRVSVPVWLIVLSDQLLIGALVSLYLTNKLIKRGLILRRWLSRRGHLFPHRPKSSWSHSVLAPVSRGYPKPKGRLSTRYSPVRHFTNHRSGFLVRLACLKHAASVRPEPESNSPV